MSDAKTSETAVLGAADPEKVLTEADDLTEEEVAEEPLLQLFRYRHLPPGSLRETSRMFCQLARRVARLPRNPERAASLRKLREAKDCAVTSLLWAAPPARGGA